MASYWTKNRLLLNNLVWLFNKKNQILFGESSENNWRLQNSQNWFLNCAQLQLSKDKSQ
jgi:hypothetical protein